MPTRLKQIEVENFKSFKGLKIIGPFQPFNAIIGPNGSGKSNLMDAISFAMGEKTQSLRVNKLSDLIHGAPIGKPISKNASVTATFSLDDENAKEISFKRSIQGSSSEYQINGNVVSNNEYRESLEKLNINVKAKNFLVFQGAVESVTMTNPKKFTCLFEEISGSIALKQDYDKLKQEMMSVQEEMNFVHHKKQNSTAERKNAKFLKEEADKYARLLDNLNDKKVQYQLFKLYHNECETKNLERELSKQKLNLHDIETKKENVATELREKKKENGLLNRDLAKLEQDIREIEVEISKKKPEFIKSKERVSHVQKKLVGATKTLIKAREAHQAHMNEIKKLQDELVAVEQLKSEYEKKITDESESQGKNIHLEEVQVREYYRLKKEVAKQTVKNLQTLDWVTMEQRSDQDKLDCLLTMKTDYENRHLQKCHEKEEIVKRMEKLSGHISSIGDALEDQKKMLVDLQSDVYTSKDRAENFQKQLVNIQEKLGEAHMDKHEEYRKKRKDEIVKIFKSNFHGVYDRLINLCQPIHERYNIPVTKVMGKFIDAIVVDTENTAKQCIQYLKEQMLEPETFLPLNYLQTVKLEEKLRNITDPKSVKLVYDVLRFPQTISKAVIFVTKNSLICETPEDANKVAFNLDERYNAVSLDGTYYNKSGIISGGTIDLARKAKKWNEKHLDELKKQKEELVEELKKTQKTLRKESEINVVDSQIRGLELRLRYAKSDMEDTKMQIKGIETELSRLTNEISLLKPQIEDIEMKMKVRKRQIQEIKSKIDNTEDNIFSKFCREIGVSNIRQYEDRDLRTQEERKQKRLEFQMQINKINSNLEYEKNRDTETNMVRWERIVIDEEKNLETSKKEEKLCKDEIDKDIQQMEQFKAQLGLKKQEAERMEKELENIRKKMKLITRDAQNFQRAVTSFEEKIENNKNERRAIIIKCKMENIAIPMLAGNMDYVIQSDPQSEGSSGDFSSANVENEARIKIDYTTLPESLKTLEDGEKKVNEDELRKSIKSSADSLNDINAPDFKAIQKMEKAQRELQSINEEFMNLQKRNKDIKNEFEKVKQQRRERFTKCLEHVSHQLDSIYKSLNQNQSAQAFLGAVNPEEPYLDGINYNCVAPGKRFQPLSNLSGGEKSIAALALLFAIHSYNPAPFFVLDEVDAAFDNTNIGKVAKYITQKTDSLQFIIISLKDEFYVHADNLIGMFKPNDCLMSEVLFMNLTKYEK